MVKYCQQAHMVLHHHGFAYVVDSCKYDVWIFTCLQIHLLDYPNVFLILRLTRDIFSFIYIDTLALHPRLHMYTHCNQYIHEAHFQRRGLANMCITMWLTILQERMVWTLTISKWGISKTCRLYSTQIYLSFHKGVILLKVHYHFQTYQNVDYPRPPRYHGTCIGKYTTGVTAVAFNCMYSTASKGLNDSINVFEYGESPTHIGTQQLRIPK